MIRRSELQQVGRLYKTHGIRGELQLELDDRYTPRELGFLVLEMDGICVPFFVAEARRRGADWLVRFDGADTDAAAASLAMHDVYYPAARLPHTDSGGDEGVYLADMAGYELRDGATAVGTIESVDDSTANVLIYAHDPAGRQLIVPYHDDLLLDYDTDARYLSLQLPRGLIELNK